MTRHRDRYAVSLEEWAALHAEELATDNPGLQQCGQEGHRPHPWHDECDDCNLEAHEMGERIKRRRWEADNDAADDNYTHRYTLED